MSQESAEHPNISTRMRDQGYVLTEVREEGDWRHSFMVMPRSTGRIYGPFGFPTNGHLRVLVGTVAVIPMDDEGASVDLKPKGEPLSVDDGIEFNLVVRGSFAVCVFTYRDLPPAEEAPPDESLDTGPKADADTTRSDGSGKPGSKGIF